MIKINEHYKQLQDAYLFSTVAKKTNAYKAAHPEKDVIKMGIGDVSLPLADEVIKAMHAAVDEEAHKETFVGYLMECGCDFLKDAVKKYYAKRDVDIDLSEIFITDGAKSDLANICGLFEQDNTVLVLEPVYPAYVDTNTMQGRKIVHLESNADNGFLPLPDENTQGDIIYICSPNNPTGAVYNRDQLKVWVDFANKNGSVIIFDAAYEAFIEDDLLPKSIYEIEGAKTCAIEICSLSKTAGFTGIRCGYTIVPNELVIAGNKLRDIWYRNRSTNFNGVCYVVQKGAAAAFSEKGYAQIMDNIHYYKQNARIICDTLDELGIWYTGGKNSPYVWLKCPNGMGSWEFFDYLLENANIVGTPGEGFGSCGEGFFRFTAFSSREATIEAMRRMKELLK